MQEIPFSGSRKRGALRNNNSGALPGNVLIAASDELLIEQAKKIAKAQGLNVIACKSQFEAEEILLSENISCVVCGDLNGAVLADELVHWVRSQPELSQVIAIQLSTTPASYDMSPDSEEADAICWTKRLDFELALQLELLL